MTGRPCPECELERAMYFAHNESCPPACTSLHMPPDDNDLPEMWEASDFIGGATDTDEKDTHGNR